VTRIVLCLVVMHASRRHCGLVKMFIFFYLLVKFLCETFVHSVAKAFAERFNFPLLFFFVEFCADSLGGLLLYVCL